MTGIYQLCRRQCFRRDSFRQDTEGMLQGGYRMYEAVSLAENVFNIALSVLPVTKRFA
jgi:hypothetical protein